MTAAEPSSTPAVPDSPTLRAQLLAEAIRRRDERASALAGKRTEAGDDLGAVARRVWTEAVDKLAAGRPYRLCRYELREGRRTDLLVLTADGRLQRAV